MVPFHMCDQQGVLHPLLSSFGIMERTRFDRLETSMITIILRFTMLCFNTVSVLADWGLYTRLFVLYFVIFTRVFLHASLFVVAR